VDEPLALLLGGLEAGFALADASAGSLAKLANGVGALAQDLRDAGERIVEDLVQQEGRAPRV
jgi:hypothetical protein